MKKRTYLSAGLALLIGTLSAGRELYFHYRGGLGERFDYQDS